MMKEVINLYLTRSYLVACKLKFYHEAPVGVEPMTHYFHISSGALDLSTTGHLPNPFEFVSIELTATSLLVLKCGGGGS